MLLAREKQGLYRGFRADGMSEEAAVALVTGAVVAVHPPGDGLDGPRAERRLRERLAEEVERRVEADADPTEPDDEERADADSADGDDDA